MQRNLSSLPPLPPCHRRPLYTHINGLAVAKAVARLLATAPVRRRWQNPLPPFLPPLDHCFTGTKGYRWHGGTGGKGFQTYRTIHGQYNSTQTGGEGE